MTAERANRILITEAQIARQRAIIARLKAQHADTADARSLLSALRYTLKLLRRRRPSLSVVQSEAPDA
jgi:hypothetical protein